MGRTWTSARSTSRSLVFRLAALGLALGILSALGAGSAQAVIPATWVAQGHGPATGGQVEGLGAQGNPVTGAVHAVVPHPTDGNILWIGAVNGGVWRTNNALALSPTWTPLTDQFPSLSISSLDLDPTAAAPLVLVAGVGRYSNNNPGGVSQGGPLTGLLRTTDGGNTWTQIGTTDLAGQNISAVAARGNVILAASNTGGLYRSIDTGANFNLLSGDGVSGLPVGVVFDLKGDPGNNNRFYAGVANAGIFRSDDGGATWTNTSGLNFGVGPNVIGFGTNHIRIAVHNNAGAGTNAVYAAVVNGGRLAGLFRSGNQGGAWTALDIPGSTEGATFIGIHNGGQGGNNTSIAADPTNANLVYLGGDRQPRGAGGNGVYENDRGDDAFPNSIGALDFSGRLFRCNASLAPGAQCAPITHVNTTGGSAPHADSRDMEFDAIGDLIEGDDGGVYVQTNPAANTGDWLSLNGDLQASEAHSCDWDAVSNIIMCGHQDAGTTEQTASGSTTWRSITTADGGIVAAADSAAPSVRYFSTQNFGNFSRRTCNAANVCGGAVGVGLIVAGSGGQNLFTFDPTCCQFRQPFELNAIDPTRMAIGTNRLYESTDQGDNLTDLTGNTGSAITRAIAYGGRSGGVDNEDVLYFGNGAALFVRTAAAGPVNQVPAYPGGSPQDIVLNPDDWLEAYVIDTNQVFHTPDAGSTWTDITGNLSTLGVGQFRSAAFIPGPVADAVLVGTDAGVFLSQTQNLGAWAEFGSNLANAPAFDLDYDAADDVLLAGTLGRGAWTVANASDQIPEADLRIEKHDFPDPVIAGEELFYDVWVFNDGPDTAFAVQVTDTLPAEVTFLEDDDNCTLDALSNELTCDLGDIPNGESRHFTIKTRVNSDAVVADPDGTLLITNTATVASIAVDPDTSNNTAVATTFVQDSADLKVTKLCKPDDQLLAGETAICTIFVDNLGPSDTRDVQMTDAIVSNGIFTIGAVTASQGSCGPPTADTVTCDLEDLPAASLTQSGRATVTIEITADEAMDINDEATVVSATPDPNTLNNQATDSISVTAVADLRISKDDAPDPVFAGNSLTYSLEVANDGPSTAVNVVVEDVVPAQVEIVSVSGSGASSCNAGTPGNPFLPSTCTYDSLSTGASRTMTIVVRVKPDAVTDVVSDAVVIHDDARVSSDTFDDDNSDNLASEDTTVQAQADLALDKTALGTPIAGTDISYRYTVENLGPSVSRDVTLRDVLPAEMEFLEAFIDVEGGTGGVSLPCTVTDGTNELTCPLGDIAPTNGVAVVVTVNVHIRADVPDGALVTNSADVLLTDTPDPDLANNTADAPITVLARADVAITKASDKDIYKPSTLITYTITVVNNGPSDAQDVVVTDDLPLETKRDRVAVFPFNGCTISGTLVTCSLGTIAAGASKSFQIFIIAKGNRGLINNTANVTTSTVDPDLSNNSDTKTVRVGTLPKP